METKKLKFNSALIHGGDHKDAFGSATVPIYQTSTFAFENADHGAKCFSGESNGYIYTRIGNPTINALERLIAELENGYGGIATSSGMAAINTVYMGLLNQGDHMISTGAVYGPARNVVEMHFSRFGIQSTYLDTSNVKEIENAIRPNTKLLYIETPANPTMDITDIMACAKIVKQKNIKLVVDNTFCSPYLQNPLDLGADVVIHSMTKFINGHADIVAGIIIAKDKLLYDQLRSMMINLGGNMDPHQAYMVHRGVKTLSIRIEKAQENAIKVAKYLQNHPLIAWIKYPGLETHPQYNLALKQMKGPGTMISFGLKGGYESAKKLMNNVQLAILAVSLGGVETLIQHPASMTHAKVSKESKQKAGITDDLIRLSVGIEDVDDILNDLRNALEKI
ncbi:MAG TPA: aminotransferase class I/II-fold pyridoxal phosphate-dependent enzyme [Bacteroidales bacterium]|nr:aminotransferase class I/II-fold pyridoxal phosphate-dependent enzyme [Bacteroidales bacterium]HQI45894.1 aminotransferase class I/II-fold pyridoxal phosphate-dependent enzyme [Bacteroidales bacterium]